MARPAHQQLFSFPFSSTYWSRSRIRTRLFGRLSGFSSVWVFAKLCYFHITIRDLKSNFLILTISSAGLKLATGTKDGQIHLWEVPSGLPLDTLSGEFLDWITLSRVFGWCWSFVCFCIRPFEWGICRQIQPRWIQTGVRFSCLFIYFYLSACFQQVAHSFLIETMRPVPWVCNRITSWLLFSCILFLFHFPQSAMMVYYKSFRSILIHPKWWLEGKKWWRLIRMRIFGNIFCAPPKNRHVAHRKTVGN